MASKRVWFCPDCFSARRENTCGCSALATSPRVGLSAPGEEPLLLGHLTILDDTPGPAELLDGLCDGPRLYPKRSSDSPSASWRHGARTVWLWQKNAETLPTPVAATSEGFNAPDVSLLRILGATSVLLMECPQRTPLFLAHYARNRNAHPAPPEVSQLIDQLQAAWELCGARVSALALLDPSGGSGREDRERLRNECAQFKVFNRRDEAIRWLMERLPSASQQRSIIPPPAPERLARLPARSVGLSPYRPYRQSKEKRIEEAKPLDVVRVADLGGSVGRHLLARLHAETLNASERAGDARRVRLQGGSHRAVSSLWALPSAEGLQYGRLQRLRNGEPAPGAPVPAWLGSLASWWGGEQMFSLQLNGSSPTETAGPIIIGVGRSRFFGEGDLSDLLDTLWYGGSRPAAIIRHEKADTTLLRWVRNELPSTPEFTDGWKGGLRALDQALRAAAQRTAR